MRRVMLDGYHPCAHARLIEAKRGGDCIGHRTQLHEIACPIADRALGPMAYEVPRLAPNMRTWIARHREPVDLLRRNAADLETAGDGAVREPRHVLDPAVAFFFGGRDQAAV